MKTHCCRCRSVFYRTLVAAMLQLIQTAVLAVAIVISATITSAADTFPAESDFGGGLASVNNDGSWQLRQHVASTEDGDNVATASGPVPEMLTKNQVHVVNTGETVRLDCEFRADERFNLFDNPVWWRKAQRHEETQVNMMGNVLEPFESTRRFRVAFQPRDPNFTLRLYIADVALEDSGNYTCEVNGPFNSLLGSITHYVFVRAAVNDVILLTQNGTDIFTTAASRYHFPPRLMTSSSAASFSTRPTDSCPSAFASGLGERSLVFVESVPGVLRCIAVGGYPPPEVQLYVGKRDVTAEFGLTHIARLVGARGLRVMHHMTERWSHRFTIGAEDDGSRVTCVVSVSGLASTVCSASLNVYHAPIVECESRFAHVGDRNVFLKCMVKARPKVTALFWILDSNGTTVTEGQVVNEHWTLAMDRGDGVIESQLFIRQTRPDHFKRYTLVAENSVSARSQDAILRPKYRTYVRQTVDQRLLNDSAAVAAAAAGAVSSAASSASVKSMASLSSQPPHSAEYFHPPAVLSRALPCRHRNDDRKLTSMASLVCAVVVAFHAFGRLFSCHVT